MRVILISTKIELENEKETFALCGKHDEHLRAIEESFQVSLLARGIIEVAPLAFMSCQA